MRFFELALVSLLIGVAPSQAPMGKFQKWLAFKK